MAAQNANSKLHAYIQNINRLYVQGRATEHSYRGDLAQLIEAIVPDIKAINEPKNDTTGKVWINDEQFFYNVPKIAWEFYIGGYQPAQKWLKDRKGRTLSYKDILHYQKIIVALSETDRLMKVIDGVLGDKKRKVGGNSKN